MLIVFSAAGIVSLLPFMVALFLGGRGGWMAVCAIACIATPLAAFFLFSEGKHLAFWIEGAGWGFAWPAGYMALGHSRADAGANTDTEMRR